MTGEGSPREEGHAPTASRRMRRAGPTESPFDAGSVLAALAVMIAVTMSVWYVALIAQEHGRPAAWAIGALVGSAVLMAYGMVRTAPGRGTALAIAGVALIVLGYLALLSIGLPILMAGMLAIIAAGLTRR
ncbi:hypothetical protein ETD86_13365 [Nonomuraea turkmeniaca]|uniref:Uncharacterized protein n=1 Tax=Nonomuraea turkmeniaca TaxID=103838 RepID=A0A5S4FMF0_9ACTN|nr:hypothetical protein [Nonomuraea turkmeniaca]TMR21907.1 hypothetical protein ETD86_13365 [Nonomuraea turkmeniaca]